MEEKGKILVVDDDPFVRWMLPEVLQSRGFSVETAENGKEAVEKFKENGDVALILTDLTMPEMSGLDLVRAFREQDVDVPVIILTVDREIGTALDAIRSGADDYLLKDENIHETLFISVDRVMEKHELKKQNMRLMEEILEKNKELERLSNLDGLTGVANRRHFETVMAHEWGRALRDAAFLSLIMIDIDYFKKFNDAYGHIEGDACLRKTALALERAVKRVADRVFRYGGEEFAAVLPNTDGKGAMRVAGEMHANVLALKTPHQASAVSDLVTVSIGAASMVPLPGMESTELIARADEALYEAKQEGRNQVRQAGV